MMLIITLKPKDKEYVLITVGEHQVKLTYTPYSSNQIRLGFEDENKDFDIERVKEEV